MNLRRLAIHAAGGLSLMGWTLLAWASHDLAPPAGVTLLLSVQTVTWLCLALAAWLGGDQITGRAVWTWAILLRLVGAASEPVLEDDHFRFLWDGRVTVLSGNPYGHPPAESFDDRSLPPAFASILDRINYPHLPTPYGPVLQAGFAASHLLSPGHLFGWKAILLAAELMMLVRIRKMLSLRWFLWLAWSPLAIFETAFNGHPDALAISLAMAALTTRLPAAQGALLALAAGARIFALPLVPFVLRGQSRGWISFLLVYVATYLPFWLQGSLAEWRAVQAMAEGWEFNSSLHALVQWALGPGVARGLCLITFSLIWLKLVVKSMSVPPSTPGPPETVRLVPQVGQASNSDLGWERLRLDQVPATALYGSLLLLSATVNPWYLMWLSPFVALRPSFAGVTAVAVVGLSYLTEANLSIGPGFEHPAWVRPVEYGMVLLGALADLWRRGSGGGSLPKTGGTNPPRA